MSASIESFFYTVLKKSTTSWLVWMVLLPLVPVSYLFFLGVCIRRWILMKKRRGRQTKTPIIAVGNITVGGTGKTPCIAMLMRQLPGRIGIVSRGYRRTHSGIHVGFGEECDPESFGDEATMLARRFPCALIAVAEDKWKAIEAIDGQCDVILLDDGLQRYDIPVVQKIGVIDCGCPDGYGWLLPRGILREPFSWLERCDRFVITNANGSLSEVLRSLEFFSRPVTVTVPRLTRFFAADGTPYELDRAKPVALVSGIARPERFAQSMNALGFTVVDHLIFKDHGVIEKDFLDRWIDAVRSQWPDVVCIATEKDWARRGDWGESPVVFAQMDLEVIHKQDEVQKAILRAFCKTRTSF